MSLCVPHKESRMEGSDGSLEDRRVRSSAAIVGARSVAAPEVAPAQSSQEMSDMLSDLPRDAHAVDGRSVYAHGRGVASSRSLWSMVRPPCLG